MPPTEKVERPSPPESGALWSAVALSGSNGFTGALLVRDGSRSGTLFFDAGRPVHAECGERSGEDALKAVMRWSGASYTLDPDRPSPRVSISRDLVAILAEVRGNAPAIESTPPSGTHVAGRAPAAGASDWLVEATEKIRRLTGVVGATLHANDAPVADLGPRTPEDAAAALLCPGARRLGEALGLGRLVLGVARGADRLVLLVTARDRHLTVLLRAGDEVESVKSQIRALLAPTR